MSRAVILSYLMAACLLVGMSAAALAQPAAKARPVPAPEVKKTVDAFVGNWRFDATCSVDGHPPAKLKLPMSCKKTALGAGVVCNARARVPGIGPWEGSYLVAHDPVGGRTHVMALTSLNEVHDHLCTWKSETELACDPLKVGPVTAELSITWTDIHTASFKSLTRSPEGVLSFEGTGKRANPPQ
jgi:hypothetical protein